MSVRMNATLYSDVVRIERGNYVTFHCVQLTNAGKELDRYFFGCYYPRWHAFYLEEVRTLIGNLGYSELRHFPAFPLDVYMKESTDSSEGPQLDMYETDDFFNDNILVIGGPQNQRDDDTKRFRIVSVDRTHLRDGAGASLQPIGATVSPAAMTTTTTPKAIFNNSSRANPDTMLSTMRALGGSRVPVEVEEEVRELLGQLRDAYVDHAGGGIPEVGLKAMGRACRVPAADGRRWLTLPRMRDFVRRSRAFGAPASSFSATGTAKATVESVAEKIFYSFPREEVSVPTQPGEALPEVGVDYDVLMDYVRGHMNSVRKAAVADLFARMDYDKDGQLSILDVQACFNAQEHPVVVATAAEGGGFFTADKLLKGFVTLWDENNHMYGMVPYTEFMDYYNGLSAIIDKDEVFLGILKTTWKLPTWTR